jgi:restriction system protein
MDLLNDLPDDWRRFNKKFIRIYLAAHPGKSKISASPGTRPNTARL